MGSKDEVVKGIDRVRRFGSTELTRWKYTMRGNKKKNLRTYLKNGNKNMNKK